MFNELFNRKNFDAVTRFFGEKLLPTCNRGRCYQSVLDDFKKYPDIQVDIKRIIAQNDLVLAHTKVTTSGMDC